MCVRIEAGWLGNMTYWDRLSLQKASSGFYLDGKQDAMLAQFFPWVLGMQILALRHIVSTETHPPPDSFPLVLALKVGKVTHMLQLSHRW